MTYPAIHAAPSREIAESTVQQINLLVDAIEKLYPPDSRYREIRRIAFDLMRTIGIEIPDNRVDLQLWRCDWTVEQLQAYYKACARRSEL